MGGARPLPAPLPCAQLHIMTAAGACADSSPIPTKPLVSYLPGTKLSPQPTTSIQ